MKFPARGILLLGLALVACAFAQGNDSSQPLPSPEAKIMLLLDRAAARLESVSARFGYAGEANEKRRVSLSDEEAALLSNTCAEFFQSLGSGRDGPSLDRLDLQHFRDQYRGGLSAFNQRYQAVERALMMGRAQIVKDLWMDTLTEYINKNPDKAGLIIGEIDIGSWIDMKLNSLSFPGDIDFSSVAVDVCVNQDLVSLFEQKLVARTGRNMIQADALLTPHGSATAHVFIGEWGKAFAEMELLRPGAVVKVLEREPVAEGEHIGKLRLDEKGRPRLKPIAGRQLFWEIAFAKAAPIEEPDFKITKEPMLTLEMWRHEKHDISQGPFSEADKLIKVMKYLERSYYVNEKALAAYRGKMPGGDPDLMKFAVDMIDAKRRKLSGAQIDKLVSDYASLCLGESLDESQGNYGQLVNRIEAKAQTAMLDNAARSVACRLKEMSGISDDADRSAALQKFWTDLDTEMAAIRENHIAVPEFIEQACTLAKQVQDGSLPPETLAKRSEDMRRLLQDAYKLEVSDIDRILNCDPYAALTKYFREKFPGQDARIKSLVDGLRKKYPNASAAYNGITRFNEDWNKTLEGSKVMSSLDLLDDAAAIYDGLLSGRNYGEGAVNATKAILFSKAAGKFPVLNIGNACWESYQAGDPAPALKSVAFYFFPTVGAFYGLGEKCQRLDAASNDENFYRHLASLRADCSFNKAGHMTRITIAGAIDGLDIPASSDAEQRARAFVDYVAGNDDLNSFGTGNPALRYWATLIPREGSEFGMSGALDGSDRARRYDITGYTRKMERLRDFFPHAPVLQQLTRLLQDVRSKPLPDDAFKAQRTQLIRDYEDSIERLVWRSLFDLLEASADPSLDAFKAELEQLEYELSLGDTSLGRDKGITSLVREELRKSRRWMDGGYKFADKFVYLRYLESYRRVKAIQAQIILLWTRTYDVEWESITATPPFKGLLGGGRNDAPRLTGNPELDLEIAESCLAAHLKREQNIHSMLTNAVRRTIDPSNDRDLLVRLAPLDFKREHLRDACHRRLISQGTDEEKARDAELAQQIKDLLNTLRPENYRYLILGKTSCQVGDKLSLEAKIEGLSETNKKRLVIVWSDGLGTGTSVSLKAAKAGRMTVRYSVYAQVNGRKTLYGEAAPFVIDVKGPPRMDENPDLKVSLAIVVRSKAPLGEKLALLARVGNLTPEQLARYRFKWYSVTDGVSLGRGQKATHVPQSVGPHTIRLEAFELDAKGSELKKGETSARLEITPAPDKASSQAFSSNWKWPDSGKSSESAAPASPSEAPGVVSAPAEVTEGVPFSVTVQLPASASRATYITCNGTEAVPEAESQRSTSFSLCIPPSNATEAYTEAVVVNAYADLRTQAPEEGSPAHVAAALLFSGRTQVRVRPVSLTASLPSGWNGNTDTRGEMTLWSNGSFQRDVKLWNLDSQSYMDAKSGYGFSAFLKMSCGRLYDYWWMKQPREFKSTEALAAAQGPAAVAAKALADFRVDAESRNFKVQAFAVGDYKGLLAESPVSIQKGAMAVFDTGAYVGGCNASASWRARVLLVRSGVSISAELGAGTHGGRDGKDDDWVRANVERLRAEALGSLASFRTRPYPMRTQSGSSAEPVEQAAGQPLYRLSVALVDISKPTLAVGETCSLRAHVVGGQAPYKYVWTNAVGQGATALARPSMPGGLGVSVEVLDARGERVTTYQNLEVTVPKPVLSLPKKTNLGQPTALRASVEYPDNEYQWLWFLGDAAPVEQLGGSSTVLDSPFLELGEVPVRVEVRARARGGKYWNRYSDSDPASVLVEASQFSISFTPADARPGDEVLAEISAQSPSLDEQLHYAWESPSSGNRWVYSDSESRIGFKLKDSSPVRLKAVALLNKNGREVGVVDTVYQPSKYSVKASLVGPVNQGPRPMVWSNVSGGLIPVEKGAFGTDESALLRAEIQPASDRVRWRWVANEDTTLQSSELSREIRAARSGPGTATLTVYATDPDGVQLGSASVSFTVVATPNVTKPAPLRAALGLGVQQQRVLVGESAFVQSSVSGGKPPYRFVWTGDHQGEGPSTNFVAFRPGKRTLRLQVFDATGRSVETEFAFEVERPPLKLSLEVDNGVLDPESVGRVTALPGEQVKLTLKPLSGRAPYKVTWEGPCKGEGLTVSCEVGAVLQVRVLDEEGARAQMEIRVEALRSLLDVPRKR